MLTSFTCEAQDISDTAPPTPTLPIQEETVEKKESDLTETQIFIKELEYVHTKPNVKADYFILLHTGSQHPQGREVMPEIVESYEDIKASERVELIILATDKEKNDVKAYLESLKTTIPATITADKTPKIPGYVAIRAIPNVSIIDKHGNTIACGGPSRLADWKKHTLNLEEEAEETLVEETPAAAE